MILKEQIIELSDGNPGAATFLTGLITEEGILPGMNLIRKLKSYGLKGSDLWVLYKDICKEDYEQVFNLFFLCPRGLLIEACKKEDGSGRELVKEYLEDHD